MLLFSGKLLSLQAVICPLPETVITGRVVSCSIRCSVVASTAVGGSWSLFSRAKVCVHVNSTAATVKHSLPSICSPPPQVLASSSY